jgi:hypothetical protein
MAFVDDMRLRIEERADLLPDAWYWLSMYVGDDLHLHDVQNPVDICDDDFVRWIKTEPDRLRKRLETHRKLRQAYAARIAELDEEIAVLSSGERPS